MSDNPAVKPDVIRLDTGGHHRPEEGMCIMEAVSIAIGAERFNALPACTNQALAITAQRVWDASDKDRLKPLVAKFLVRLMRARRTNDDRRITAEFCLFMAKRYKRLDEDGKEQEIIDLMEAVLAGDRPARDLQNLLLDMNYTRQRGMIGQAASLVCAALLAYMDLDRCDSEFSSLVFRAFEYHHADAFEAAQLERLEHRAREHRRAWGRNCCDECEGAVKTAEEMNEELLDALLSFHEKLLADTPEGIYVPTPWEDEALAWVDEILEKGRT